MDDLIIKFCDMVDGYEVIFEDDGRVAYAYLVRLGRIISDVWIYNRITAPDTNPWAENGKTLYLNPKEFTKNIEFKLPNETKDVSISWEKPGKGIIIVKILIDNLVVGALSNFAKIGCSALASKDGPLARVLD